MIRKVKIADGFDSFQDLFSPKIVAEVNGQHVKLVLVEPDGIAHTGDVEAEITLDEYERLSDR